MGAYSYWDYGPSYYCRHHREAIQEWGLTTRFFLSTYQGATGPTAFLLGVIFDGLVLAERAWAAPVMLRAHLGHLRIGRLARMHASQLASALAAARCGARYPRRVARFIKASSAVVLDDYAGRPENIWLDALTTGEVIQRFERLPGVSQKKARMAVKLLVLGFMYGRYPNLERWCDLDMAVDRHTARVFLRTGLVPYAPRFTPSASRLIADVTYAARRLSPDFPARLDDPAFEIGRDYCSPQDPDCQACPLGRPGVCRRRIHMTRATSVLEA
jgi:endonuclease III